MPTLKPYYLAGPMTGIPKFNFPLFDKASEELRDRGWHIVSPAEMDSGAYREFALASVDGKHGPDGRACGQTWADILARDVKIVADACDGIILLPDWHTSRGARLEAFVGLLCGHSFFLYADGGDTYPVDHDYIRSRVV